MLLWEKSIDERSPWVRIDGLVKSTAVPKPPDQALTPPAAGPDHGSSVELAAQVSFQRGFAELCISAVMMLFLDFETYSFW